MGVNRKTIISGVEDECRRQDRTPILETPIVPAIAWPKVREEFVKTTAWLILCIEAGDLRAKENSCPDSDGPAQGG